MCGYKCFPLRKYRNLPIFLEQTNKEILPIFLKRGKYYNICVFVSVCVVNNTLFLRKYIEKGKTSLNQYSDIVYYACSSPHVCYASLSVFCHVVNGTELICLWKSDNWFMWPTEFINSFLCFFYTNNVLCLIWPLLIAFILANILSAHHV